MSYREFVRGVFKKATHVDFVRWHLIYVPTQDFDDGRRVWDAIGEGRTEAAAWRAAAHAIHDNDERTSDGN